MYIVRRMHPLFNKDEGGEIPAWGKSFQDQLNEIKAKLDKPDPNSGEQGQTQPQVIPQPKPQEPEESKESGSSTEQQEPAAKKRTLWDFLM